MSSYEPSTAYQNRLPGHPGAAQRPAYSSPQGLYEYIAANVPGISPGAAEWLHGRILGGGNFLADTLGAQLAGLSPAQLAQIGALQPFMGGASSVQPVQPGDLPGPGGPPVAPPPPPPPGPPPPVAGDGSLGWTVPSGPIVYPPVQQPVNSTDVSAGQPRPIHTPPAEDWTLPVSNGWTSMGPTNPYTGAPPGGIDFGNFYPPHDVGPGARLAEGALRGLGAPSLDAHTRVVGDPSVSPVSFLRRHRFVL